MKRLDQLHSISEEMLGGLKAGSSLKERILQKASPNARQVGHTFRPALAALLVCVVAVGLYAALPKQSVPNAPDTLRSIAAGQPGTERKVRALIDLPPGSVTLSAGTSAPEYRSLWEAKKGADFPLVGVDGRFYRLMKNPSAISDDMLGDAVGDVQEYTSEPSLSAQGGLISNIVSQGETVWALDGMAGAAVAAKVEGTLRVFQRVSYAGGALVGKESLNDTLKVSGKVVGLEVSGIGTITDAQTASALVDTLLTNAVYESASLPSSDQSLLIQLDTGVTMQLLIDSDMVSACGTWSCPEFFEAFRAAVGK